MNRHARLWDVGTGKAGWALPHSETVTAVAFRPGGGRPAIVTASVDRTARLWDPAEGHLFGAPMVLRFPIYSVAFSADGRCLVLGGGHRPEPDSQFGEGEVRLFDGHTALPLIGPIPVPGIVHHVAASPRGNHLAAAAESGPYQWSVVGAQSQICSVDHPGVLQQAVVSRNGRTLASLSAGPGEAAGQVFLWDGQTGRPIAGPLSERAGGVDLAPDGKRLLTLSGDKVLCWDAATGNLQKPRLGGLRIQHATFALDGRAILLRLPDQKVRLVSADTGAPLGPTLSYEQELIAADDGRAFVSTASQGKRVEVRDTRTGELLGPPLDHAAGVAGLSSSEDGRRIATVDGGGTFRVWDVPGGTVLVQFTEPGNRKGVRLAPDGSVVAVFLDSPRGLHLRVVRLWDVALGRPLPHSLPERAGHIVFHPSSKLLAVSEGAAVRLWDVATGRPVGPALRHLGTLSTLDFARDGQVLLTTDVDRTIRLWSVPVPVAGAAARVRRWVESLTGLEVDEAGAIRPLDGATWDKRRREFPAAP
jgi:WD40 repeat protein